MIKKLVAVVVVCSMMVSCAKKYQQFIPNYTFHSGDGKPDYANLDYWAAHPDKKDPADSLPKALKHDYKSDSSVDVFFIHPTSYTDSTFPFGYNAPVDDPTLNAKTDYGTILYQASIFNATGRVFAPRYRQANYWCYFPKDSLAAVAAFQLAYEDVKTAFEYYMAHYNNGRPVIIAAHSQGTTHALTLLKEFFDGKPLQNQLVAAYLVGMPVRPDYFSALKPCTSPDATGCICSWRTMQTGYITPFAAVETYTAIVTNPLTWTASEPDAPRSANPGSVLRKFKKIKPHITNASIHNGVLWCDKPKFFGNCFIHFKNYHVGDYNFYYLSVRRNAQLRAQTFLKKEQVSR
ncbi:MAG: DUF3089 domain-containing protein [Bacteroidota bacterium]